jgi:hypothetical protein
MDPNLLVPANTMSRAGFRSLPQVRVQVLCALDDRAPEPLHAVEELLVTARGDADVKRRCTRSAPSLDRGP